MIMTSRKLIKDLINGKSVPRCGFWMGHPHKDNWPILLDYFNADSEAEVRSRLHDDIIWIPGDSGYKSPDGGSTFPNPRKGEGLSCAGVFSECTDIAEVEAYPWPDPANFDFTEVISKLKSCGDVYRASGLWSPFFHLVGDMFGMENYFIKMYTDPDVVQAVTTRVVDFYLAGTRRLFEEAGDEIDAFFFGNDFGTQLDTLISPDCFEKFVFPYFRKLTELGHEFGKHVILHSCGSIFKVIPRLLELGVDVLHPLQAKAANMDAQTLSQFKGKVTFLGGIDTQDLLMNGSSEDIKADVRRVIDILGPKLIISPSHECLLPNIPPQNVEAMSQAVFGE
jgi:uroporphyrinogen decarboxylase